MQGILSKPIGLIPVITDEEKRLTEAVDIDRIWVAEYSISYMRREASFLLGFAGVDSTGRLHPVQGESGAGITLKAEKFDALFCDAHGNPKFLDRALWDDIFSNGLIPQACKHWKMPQLEVSVDGVPVHPPLPKSKAG